MRKPVFGVFNQIRHKAGCIHVATKYCYMLEILCSENTGSVSLFSHMQKADFLMARLKCELGLVGKCFRI